MRNENKVAKIINEEFDSRMDLAVLQYLCEQVGIDRAKEITDDEIEAIEGNGLMTKHFCQAMVRCARRIARECSFINDIVPYMVENFEHLTGHITRKRTEEVLLELIDKCDRDNVYGCGFSFGELSEFLEGHCTDEELKDLGLYEWINEGYEEEETE